MDKLRKLQLVEKDCLDFFVKICEENNLGYILDFGTLLGAVRHKGFIPWDDDVDLGMPREDYEKFLKIFDKYTNNGRFSLETYKRGAFYKLKDNNHYILNEDGSPMKVCQILFRYYKTFQGFMDVNHFAKKQNCRVINHTTASLIDAFERV